MVTSGIVQGQPHVSVIDRKGQPVECSVETSPEGFTGHFTPVEAGPHTVNVTLANTPISNSPFKINATDVSKVLVKDLPHSKLKHLLVSVNIIIFVSENYLSKQMLMLAFLPLLDFLFLGKTLCICTVVHKNNYFDFIGNYLS